MHKSIEGKSWVFVSMFWIFSRLITTNFSSNYYYIYIYLDCTLKEHCLLLDQLNWQLTFNWQHDVSPILLTRWHFREDVQFLGLFGSVSAVLGPNWWIIQPNTAILGAERLLVSNRAQLKEVRVRKLQLSNFMFWDCSGISFVLWHFGALRMKKRAGKQGCYYLRR